MAERTGMGFASPDTVKLCKRVWPRIDAAAGTTVYVQMGGALVPDIAPTWGTAVPFVVGTDQKVDLFATGKYLSVRFYTTADANWRMRGCAFEVQQAGKF